MSKKYVYGLDLSISRVGLSIYDLDEQKYVLVDSKSTRQKDTHGERLGVLRAWAKEYKREYPPYAVAIETGFTRFHKATQVIFRVHGVFNELFKESPQEYYAPTTVKKDITGNGRANKSQVAHSVMKLVPDLKISNDDESDAVAVIYSYLTEHDLIK